MDPRSNMPKAEAHRINSVLESIRGWKRAGAIRIGPGYGTQKGFRRALDAVNHVNQVEGNFSKQANQAEKVSTKTSTISQNVNHVQNLGVNQVNQNFYGG